MNTLYANTEYQLVRQDGLESRGMISERGLLGGLLLSIDSCDD